ncbi:alkaline-phosphatase-like protein [Pavlovales sp. CCMP2436]|nr:alkaline-phosphatase-like protein [Pavlovales sp. CCMP2436]
MPQHMGVAVRAEIPFFVHFTPAMIHYGSSYRPPDSVAFDDPRNEAALPCPTTISPTGICVFKASPCPSTRNKFLLSGVSQPRVPNWNRTTSGVHSPAEVRNKRFTPATSSSASHMDMSWRNRSSSAVDLDDMIGTVLDGIEELGQAESTWVIFTSDNGYHLGHHTGEWKSVSIPYTLSPHAGRPYVHDTSVPLYIRGPGLPANSRRAHPSTLIDITATMVEMAGAKPSIELDGKSFLPALGADPVDAEAWRAYQYVENGQFWSITFPFNQTVVHWYCEGVGLAGVALVGTPSVFDLQKDQWELLNLAGAEGTPAGNVIVAAALPLAAGMSSCAGRACNRAPRVQPDPIEPLPCYEIIRI